MDKKKAVRLTMEDFEDWDMVEWPLYLEWKKCQRKMFKLKVISKVLD